MNINIEQIREIAQICAQNGLSVLDIADEQNHIRIERNSVQALVPAAPAPTAAAAAIAPVQQQADPGINFANVDGIKSPMIGVFYCAPSPDAEPFVKVGSRVKKGDVVCIIEAMKLMNEITAERDGEIVDQCVSNGDVVEFGQTLFTMY